MLGRNWEEENHEPGEYVTEINRPTEDVFALLESFERFPEWNTTVTRSRRTSDGPLGVGSTAVVVGKFLGLSYEMHSVFTEYVPNQKIASKTVSGPFHLEVEYKVEPADGGAGFTTVVTGDS